MLQGLKATGVSIVDFSIDMNPDAFETRRSNFLCGLRTLQEGQSIPA
jgi:hypothetical protein